MALMNFSLPFGVMTQPWSPTISPLHSVQQLASSSNSLLYSPADHQQNDDVEPPTIGSEYYKNNPYAHPQLHQESQNQQNSKPINDDSNKRNNFNTYLPPIPPPGMVHNSLYRQQQQQNFNNLHTEQEVNNNRFIHKSTTSASSSSVSSSSSSRVYDENSYSRLPTVSEKKQSLPATQQKMFNTYGANTASILSLNRRSQQQAISTHQNEEKSESPSKTYGPSSNINERNIEEFPERPAGYTRVQAGQGSQTRVHAVLDYDVEENDEEYFDAEDHDGQEIKDGSGTLMPTVTPIQGPIYLKNGTVPVVPLFAYPKLNNGSFIQIPIWWTALSVALGLDVSGDIIKGVPCIKRYHQLFCPTAGNTYPIEKIERFIDDNKALMRRMYGDFEMSIDSSGPKQQSKKRKRRFIDEPELFIPPGSFVGAELDSKNETPSMESGDSYFGKMRSKRQSNGSQNHNNNRLGSNRGNRAGSSSGTGTGRLDACESKIEIVTPYWASNSAGKIRAIVNTQHFEQAIHQEVCSKTQTSRCEGECGCEQKYKWHRLLAYDPDNDCKGIFMDWFLFPSCCVCRCNPL